MADIKRYLLRTKTSVKENEAGRIWVDRDIVSDFETDAANIAEALLAFRKWVAERSYIDISDSALRRKMSMYIDTFEGVKQVGYVITGLTEIENKRHYIDLWVSIDEIIPAF